MTKSHLPGDPGLLPRPIMRRMLEAACEFHRLRPWQEMSDTVFVGCRDERTRELRICSTLGSGNEVFGKVSYRGPEGIGLVHELVTQEQEPSQEQLLRGMNCIKLEFSLKRELSHPDLERLTSVAYKPQGRGKVWPAFHSWRPSWAPWPVNEEESIQLTEDLRKVCRFAPWFKQNEDMYKSHPRTDIPIVELGDDPLTDDGIDWMPLLPPVGTGEGALTLSSEEIDQLRRLPTRQGASEVETAYLHAAAFMGETGRGRVPLMIIMSDRASYFVQAAEFFDGDQPLQEGLRKVVLEGMIKHGTRPERILVSDEKLFRILKSPCAQIEVELDLVNKLVAAPDALESLASHLRHSAR